MLLEYFWNLFLTGPSVLWHCWLGGRKGIRPVENLGGGCGGGGAVSPVGVAPTRSVSTSASIIFPCSIKIQKTGGGETQPERSTDIAKAEGRVFLLVPAYLGCPGTKAVKLLLLLCIFDWHNNDLKYFESNTCILCKITECALFTSLCCRLCFNPFHSSAIWIFLCYFFSSFAVCSILCL